MSELEKAFAEQIKARAKELLAEPKDYSGSGWDRAGALEETVRRLLEVMERHADEVTQAQVDGFKWAYVPGEQP